MLYLIVLLVTLDLNIFAQSAKIIVQVPPDTENESVKYRLRFKPKASSDASNASPIEILSKFNTQEVTKICGYSAIKLIQGGENAQPGEFPWLGALFIRNVQPPRYICTVNIITRKHLLTAAHCLSLSQNPEDYHIILGFLMPQPHQTMSISGITNHPQYRALPQHDISILSVPEDLKFTSIMLPVCLQLPEAARNSRQSGIVAGFGPDYSTYRKLQMPLVSAIVCRDNHVLFRTLVNEYTFCAGDRDLMGPCRGDSGAGYMQDVEGRLYLRGIVSHSAPKNGTCDLSKYIIFADLDKELGWLNNVTRGYL